MGFFIFTFSILPCFLNLVCFVTAPLNNAGRIKVGSWVLLQYVALVE